VNIVRSKLSKNGPHKISYLAEAKVTVQWEQLIVEKQVGGTQIN